MILIKNKKGSSLIFAVIAIMIITVTIAAAYAISYSYYNRSLVNNSKKQAYLSAKTVLTTICEGVMDKNDFLNFVPIPPKQTTLKLKVDDNFPAEMGTIDKIGMTVNIKEDISSGQKVEKYILTVYVQATYGEQSITINGDFERLKETDDIESWTFLKYYEGEIKESHNIQIAKEMLENTSKIRELADKILASTDPAERKTLEIELSNYLKQTSGDNSYSESVVLINDRLRKYYYDVYQKGSQNHKLNIDEFEVSDKMKAYYTKYPLYLHIMFGYQGRTSQSNDAPKYLIYATSTKEDMYSADWTPAFVYIPETGHWYKGKGNPLPGDGTYETSSFPGLWNFNNGDEIANKTYQDILKLCTQENIVQ